MKIIYISDIHLEFLKKYPKIENKDYENTILCLLGDIGYIRSEIYKEFINYCSKIFKKVLVIFGNHEFYDKCHTIEENKNYIKENLKFTNVYFLDNKSIIINNIKFIGCTLWSNIDPKISHYISDYYNIKSLKYTDTIVFFNESKNYILDELKKAKKDNIKCILLTHHGTHYLCNGKYKDSQLGSAFFSTIHELVGYDDTLLACINGHTHQNIDTKIPNTNIRLLSNCVGYETENLNYNINKFLFCESEITK